MEYILVRKINQLTIVLCWGAFPIIPQLWNYGKCTTTVELWEMQLHVVFGCIHFSLGNQRCRVRIWICFTQIDKILAFLNYRVICLACRSIRICILVWATLCIYISFISFSVRILLYTVAYKIPPSKCQYSRMTKPLSPSGGEQVNRRYIQTLLYQNYSILKLHYSIY